jgi:hypothetical protein
MDVDDLIRLRGIKPKQNGKGCGAGYKPEQRKTHLKAASVIFDLWLDMHEVVIYQGKQKRPRWVSA